MVETVEVIKAPKSAPATPPKPLYPWRILLEDNDLIPTSGQFFGINGKGFTLKAGMEADVPESIVHILNDAIVSVAVKDPDTQRVIGYKERLRFPYRVLRQPK